MCPKLNQQAVNSYHEWYADNVGRAITYLGTPIMKNVCDLWNYQQVIYRLWPSLVIEFGTAHGGSALWFADLMQRVNPVGLVYSVDIADVPDGPVKRHSLVRLEKSDSVAPAMLGNLLALRTEYPGPVFAILDSDHKKGHVLAEMELLRSVLRPGDYLVIEDSCINGHPIYKGWGEGPFEAIEEYERRYPYDFDHDRTTEQRFGFTFATNGYLVRR